MANHEPDRTGPAPGSPDDGPAARTIEFLDRCRHRMEHLAEPAPTTHRADATAGAAALATAIDRARQAPPKAFEATWLPVLDSIDLLTAPEPTDPDEPADANEPADADEPADAVDPIVALRAELVTLAPDLPWVPTHRATDGGTELALAPLDRMLDLGDTIVGLMYVGPNATYPLHQHPPQELYLTIAGHGRWRYGGNEERQAVGPDRTLYNHPGDLHTAEAGALPVVALYVLW